MISMFKIEISANNVTELKGELQRYLTDLGATESVQQTQLTAPVKEVSQPPVQTAAPVVQQPPVQIAPAQPVPTAAPQYSHEQLAQAAATLMESNPAVGAQLTAILQSFGVQGLTEIPANQLGAVAQQIRQLGAVI